MSMSALVHKQLALTGALVQFVCYHQCSNTVWLCCRWQDGAIVSALVQGRLLSFIESSFASGMSEVCMKHCCNCKCRSECRCCDALRMLYVRKWVYCTSMIISTLFQMIHRSQFMATCSMVSLRDSSILQTKNITLNHQIGTWYMIQLIPLPPLTCGPGYRTTPLQGFIYKILLGVKIGCGN